MSEWVHRTIVVPASFAPLARALCDGIAPGGSGAGMFVAELSPNGQAPATHYVSAGLMWPQFADLLTDPAGIAQASGGQVTLQQAQALVNASIVSPDDPQLVLDANGLHLVLNEIP